MVTGHRPWTGTQANGVPRRTPSPSRHTGLPCVHLFVGSGQARHDVPPEAGRTWVPGCRARAQVPVDTCLRLIAPVDKAHFVPLRGFAGVSVAAERDDRGTGEPNVPIRRGGAKDRLFKIGVDRSVVTERDPDDVPWRRVDRGENPYGIRARNAYGIRTATRAVSARCVPGRATESRRGIPNPSHLGRCVSREKEKGHLTSALRLDVTAWDRATYAALVLHCRRWLDLSYRGT